jgi:hypothetical protein
MRTPFPIDPALTAIVIAYRNQRLIANDVLPRIGVGKAEFRWMKHAVAESFTVPDTKVGRKSSPNQVEFSATEMPGFTVDYGLDDVVPADDVNNSDTRYNPIDRAVLGIADLIALDREVRVAAVMQNPANFAGSVALAGNSQWSDYVNSNPVNAILTAMDSMIVRPNKATIGRAAYTVLRQHPKMVEAVKATGAGGVSASGTVTARQIADVLELEDLYVGEAFLNTAKKGQNPSMSRVWGKNFAMWYSNPIATNRQGMTFGYTAEFGTPVAGQWEVKEDSGLRGGIKVRAGESVQEVVAATDLGYLFQTVTA